MNASIAKKTDQLSTDNKALKIYENECAQGIVKTNDFKSIMKDASIEAQEYAVQTKGAAGSAQVFSAKQEQALKELKATANASKGAAVAMKAVSIAINMAAMWAISTVVSIVAEKIAELANASKLAAEKAAAFAESVNSVFQDMSGNLSTLSSLNDEYQKLSKGVNEAGKNVSLSTNEYDRYKEIISDISDIMPNLTTFFNSQGEKIAFAKGELADLNKEYEAYLQQQAKEFLTNGDESGNTVQDVLDNYNYNKEFGLFENLGNMIKNRFQFYDLSDMPAEEIIASLEKISTQSKEELVKYLDDIDINILHPYLTVPHNREKKVLQKILGFSPEEISNLSDKEFDELQASILANIEILQAGIDNDMSQIHTVLLQSAYFKDSFWAIDDEAVRTNITTLLSSITSDVWDQLDLQDPIDIQTFVSKIIEAIYTNKDGFADAWNGLFDSDLPQLPVDEYISKVQSYFDTIADVLELNEDGRELLMISLGFDFSDIEPLKNNVKEKLSDEFDDRINELTLDELIIAAEQIEVSEGELLSWDELIKKIEKIKALASHDSFSLSTVLTNSKEDTDSFTSSLQSAYDAYNTLLSPNVSSSDTLSSLIAMNDAISGMGRKINWEFLGDIPETHRLESLGTVLDNIAGQAGDALKASLHSGNEAYDEFIDTMVEGMVRQQQAASEFNNMNAHIDSLQSSYQTLSGILSSYNSTGYLTLDNLQSLLTADENLISMLEVEDGQLSINKTAYQNLVAVQLAELKTKLGAAAAAEIEALAKDKTARATNANADASHSAVKELDAETDAFNRNTSAAIANAIATAEKEGVNEDDIRSILNKYNDIWDSAVKGFDSDFSSFMGAASSSASGTAEKTLEEIRTEWKEHLDKYLELYKSELEAGLIDFDTFLTKSKNMIDEFYRDGKISAGDYWAEMKSLYENQLSIYDNVLSAVDRRIDREIDGINAMIDGLEEQNDALEEQKNRYDSALSAVQDLIASKKELYQKDMDGIESENDALQEQIDRYNSLLDAVSHVFEERRDSLQNEMNLIQERIDALQEANDAQQQSIELEKARYELERARNQRTRKVFNGTEFVYEADHTAVHDARDTLSDLELETAVDTLEQEKEAIQEVIDGLDRLEEAWNQIPDAFTRIRNTSAAENLLGSNYKDIILNSDPELIKSIMNSYTNARQRMEDNNTLIASIEEKMEMLDSLSDKWSETADEREQLTNRENAIQLLGQEWETMILEQREETFNSFKNEYLAIQARIDDNTSLINSYEEKIEYYELLKEQWADISSVYEQSTEDQYAAMVLGQNWESEVLNGRLDTLRSFRDEYVSIQQAITEANNAMLASNIEAQSSSTPSDVPASASGSNSGSGNSKNSAASDKPESEAPSFNIKYNSNGQTLSTASAIKDVKEWAADNGYDIRTIHGNDVYVVQSRDDHDEYDPFEKYAAGTSNARKGLNLVGEKGTETYIDKEGNISLVTKPTLIPMEGGEQVKNARETKALLNADNLTPLSSALFDNLDSIGSSPQNALWDNLQKTLPDLSYMIHPVNTVPMPSFDYINGIRGDNISLNIGPIHLHEVNDADSLSKAIINYLPGKMLQAMNKR